MSDQLNKIAYFRCKEIIRATCKNEKFDPSFIEKMMGYIENNRFLTGNQYSAIESIYDSWTN